MIERNANLPSTRSKPSIKFTSRRDSGVGYEPVSVVMSIRLLELELKIVCRESQVVKFQVRVGAIWEDVRWNYVSESVFLLAMHLRTSLLPNYYLKTKLLEDIGSGSRLIKEALRRADNLFFIKLYVF